MLTIGAPASSTEARHSSTRELLLDGRFVFANAAAAGAGEVAGVQRLEHQHQREALLAPELLLDHVAGHVGGQAEGETHDRSRSQGTGVRNQLGHW